MGLPIIKIRRSDDRLIFMMEITYLEIASSFWNGAPIFKPVVVMDERVSGYSSQPKWPPDNVFHLHMPVKCRLTQISKLQHYVNLAVYSSCPGFMRVKHGVTVRIHKLSPRQNGRHFADNIFKRVFLNKNPFILFQIIKFHLSLTRRPLQITACQAIARTNDYPVHRYIYASLVAPFTNMI